MPTDAPLTWTMEIARARDAGNPHEFKFERQHYNFRGERGRYGHAEFPWDTVVLSTLAELQRPQRASGAAHRLGELLRTFLEAGLSSLEGWSKFEDAVLGATREGRALHLTLRFGAAELYTLPWELTTLRSSGEHLGRLPGCLIHYEWPGAQVARAAETPSRAPGRLLFGWSVAGGDVPWVWHQDALARAASRGTFTFDSDQDTVPKLSTSSLRDSLRRATEEGRPFSALHLLCHGGRNASGNHGLLWNASSPEEGAALVDAEELSAVLGPYRDALRLVMLCACNSGDAGVPGNALGSVAQALHRLGIPAVVASRLALSVEGSVQLADSFYGTWDGSSRVQPALLEARRALVDDGGYDWASIQLFATVLSSAQQRVLRGQVLLMGKDGQHDKTQPARKALKRARLELFGYGNPVRPSSSGQFELFLPDALKPGAPMTLTVEMNGYRIWEPADGNTRVPLDLATESLKVQMLPVGSKRFLSDEGIERLIEQAATNARKRLDKEDREDPPRVQLSRTIADWAYQYGFSAHQVKEEVDRWVALVERNRDDERRLALAAFARGEFEVAAGHARAAASLKLQRRALLEQEHRRLGEEAARDFELEGDAHYSNNEFAKALESYSQGLKYVSHQHSPQAWVSLMTGAANSHQELGKRVEGSAAREHLNEAVTALYRILEIATREALPQDWAATQNNLAIALRTQAERTEGEAGTRLLAQAVEAYRLALQVRTREALPQNWAATQNNLANALLTQAERTEGDAGTRLLAQAVEAYRLALQVYTREALPQHWATTQHNLAIALSIQAERTEGDAGTRLLAQAVEAYRLALQVYTREALPQHWATTQHNLAIALRTQAERTAGDADTRLLAQAVEAFRLALQVRTREVLPLDWAATQHNLAVALSTQAERTEGDAGTRLLAQAVEAYRLALRVYTREALPQDWAETQHNLAIALSAQARNYREQLLESPRELIHRVKLAETLLWLETPAEATALLSDMPEAPPTSAPQLAVPARAMLITALLATKAPEGPPIHLAELHSLIKAQPATFKVGWDFANLQCFIDNSEKMAASRAWLTALFQALQRPQRDEMLAALTALRDRPKQPPQP
jgi:tetratricopeptide (TPR) repeat protein